METKLLCMNDHYHVSGLTFTSAKRISEGDNRPTSGCRLLLQGGANADNVGEDESLVDQEPICHVEVQCYAVLCEYRLPIEEGHVLCMQVEVSSQGRRTEKRDKVKPKAKKQRWKRKARQARKTTR